GGRNGSAAEGRGISGEFAGQAPEAWAALLRARRSRKRASRTAHTRVRRHTGDADNRRASDPQPVEDGSYNGQRRLDDRRWHPRGRRRGGGEARISEAWRHRRRDYG